MRRIRRQRINQIIALWITACKSDRLRYIFIAHHRLSRRYWCIVDRGHRNRHHRRGRRRRPIRYTKCKKIGATPIRRRCIRHHIAAQNRTAMRRIRRQRINQIIAIRICACQSNCLCRIFIDRHRLSRRYRCIIDRGHRNRHRRGRRSQVPQRNGIRKTIVPIII